MAEGTPDIQALTARMLEQEAAGDLAGAARTLVGMLEWPVDLRAATSDPALRRALYDAHSGLDGYSGQPINVTEMHVDHIIPRHLGGPDHVWNYLPTSELTNARKSGKFSPRHALALLYMNIGHYAPRTQRRLGAERIRRPGRAAEVKREFPGLWGLRDGYGSHQGQGGGSRQFGPSLPG